MDSTEGGIVVTNGAESSLVSKVKEKQDQISHFSSVDGKCSKAKSIIC